MAHAIEWDKTGEHVYEIGVDHGVLYPMEGGQYVDGIPWNGLINVTESPSGAESTKLYADNIPYLTLRSTEEFGATIECYTYPEEFDECNGAAEVAKGVKIGQQYRKNFGLSYRTKIGNDTENENHGYKLHLIYGCSTNPSEKAYQTINDSPDAITFSYEITTNPINVEGQRPTATLVIDSREINPKALAAIEDILYGTPVSAQAEDGESGVAPRLPLPDEIVALIEEIEANEVETPSNPGEETEGGTTPPTTTPDEGGNEETGNEDNGKPSTPEIGEGEVDWPEE